MTKSERKPVTINEVANEAGVSITTVSRVLNNNYPVKQETREKIERAIEKLQFRPNIMARGLIIKRTSVIGVVVPGLTNLFFPTIVEAIDSVIKNKGYSIFLNNTSGDAELEKQFVNKMISMQVDGIVAIDPALENLKNGFYDSISEKLPVVIINANSPTEKLNYITYNEEIGTIEAFEYLIGLGHRKIAFLRGQKSFSYDIKEKIYKDMAGKYGLDYRKIIRIDRGNTIEATGQAELKINELLRSPDRPTAVFACNDLMAAGVIGAGSDIGLKVPEDLSIIGFDNTLISKISHPRLTTVDLKMEQVGTQAAEGILGLVENEFESRIRIVINTELVIRDSCTLPMSNTENNL